MSDQTTDVPIDLEVASESSTLRRRERVGDAIGRTANRLHQKADEYEGKVNRAINSAADALDSTGKYLHDFDGREAMSELTSIARKHPGKSLLAAVVLGFVVGRSFSRSDHT